MTLRYGDRRVRDVWTTDGDDVDLSSALAPVGRGQTVGASDVESHLRPL
ncbi:MAG: hypothetical protein QOH72_4714 [Solirubrobacteraceae bacterium]|jgi:hypothetical protein|nr:hypothetical protein [Solirubrobacteraceae bacterium]